MIRLGFLWFCFLAALAKAAELRSPFIESAITGPSDDPSPAHLREDVAEFDDSLTAGSSPAHAVTLSKATAAPESSFPLAEHPGFHEEAVDGALDANMREVPEEAAMSPYDLQVQKERQARRRMGKAALMLVIAVLFAYILARYTTWYVGRNLAMNLMMGSDISFRDFVPKGIHAVIFLILALPALLVPVATVYTLVRFFSWLRQFIIASSLKKKESVAAGGNSKAAEAGELAAAAAAPPSGFNP